MYSLSHYDYNSIPKTGSSKFAKLMATGGILEALRKSLDESLLCLCSPFDTRRANGPGIEIVKDFPFVLSLSKHGFVFSGSSDGFRRATYTSACMHSGCRSPRPLRNAKLFTPFVSHYFCNASPKIPRSWGTLARLRNFKHRPYVGG